ncbi:actin-binding protein WASF1-like [Cavia porcellus]|uniref:actin-binding protein WASF1-like n=1 Tax=Cavia porcellus TaxID=10141 RepID=UPI002FE2029B
MSAEPLNEQDEDHQTKQVTPKEFQEEIIRVIQTCLRNIAVQIQNLNSYADHLFAHLSKEVDNTSWTYMALHKRVVRLMGATYKEPHSQVSKSKKATEASLPMEQVYCSQAVAVKMYKISDAHGQILPLSVLTPYSQDDTGLNNFSDSSCSFESCKEKFTHESKAQKQEILKGQDCLYHPNEPESVPLCQLRQNDVSVDYSQADCGDISHSLVHQPVECSSFSTPSFTEISDILMRAISKVLANPLHSSSSRAEDLEDTRKFTHYGVGMGEKLEPQPPIQHKREVFVRPTAPPSPPPLLVDCLSHLSGSKTPNTPTTFPSPILSPSSLLRTPAASHPQCLQITPEAGVPITTPKVDSSSPVPEHFQYCEMVPHNRIPPDEEMTLSPLKSPFPIISYGIKMKDTVTDQVGHTSTASLIFPSESSSFAQSPRHRVTKLPRSSDLPTAKSSTLAPSRYPITASKPSAAPLSGHSTLKSSQSSAPLSSSGQQASRFLTQSGKLVSTQSTRHPVAQ